MEAFDEINNELKDIAPLLSSLPRQNAFIVEDSYFDKLPTMVMNRIHTHKKKSWIDISWIFQPRWAMATALMAICIVAGSFLLMRYNNRLDKPLPVAQVQKSLVEPITTDNVLDDVDADVMADMIADLGATQKKDIRPKKANNTKATDKKAVEDYILDNVDDNSIIDAL
jgi:hypothetical protein